MAPRDGPDGGASTVSTAPPTLPVPPTPPVPPDDQEPLPERGRRRRWWIILGTVLAVLVLAVPLLVYLAVRGDETPSTAPSTDVPQTSASAPGGTPSTGGQAAGASAGRIPRSELFNGTFDIPAWPADAVLQAPTRQLTFRNGRTVRLPDGRITTIEKVAYADVNHDRRDETLAVISLTMQGGIWQVAVFTRNTAGAIVPFGQVLATTGHGPIMIIGDVAAGANGTVRVMVGDDVPCCGVTPDMVQYQWRTYSYEGTAFHQRGGPTEFGRDLRFPDLAVGPTQVPLGAPVDGVRHGVIVLTIRNRGTVAASGMIVGLRLAAASLTPEGPGWAGFVDDQVSWTATKPAPAPGDSVTLSLGVHRPSSADQTGTGVFMNVAPLDNDGNQTKDAWFADNAITISVTVTN